MKNLEEALRELHPKLTIYKLHRELGKSIALNSLYLISRDPETNIKLSTANLIFEITKERYGRGLCPWDYLNVLDWRKNEKRFKN
jgi:hypothetical protein